MRTARTIADSFDFDITNLSLQKLIYLSHMYHLGKTGNPLVDGHFEAWDLGPVEPDVYHLLKAYGARPVRDVFAYPCFEDGTPEKQSIDDVLEALRNKSPAQLVQITHQNWGAWAKNYRPGIRSARIPEEDILEEYHRRQERVRSHQSGEQ